MWLSPNEQVLPRSFSAGLWRQPIQEIIRVPCGFVVESFWDRHPNQIITTSPLSQLQYIASLILVFQFSPK